jgi:hypothetical protein
VRIVLLLLLLTLSLTACGRAPSRGSSKPTLEATATSAPGAIQSPTPLTVSTQAPSTPVRAVAMSGSYRAFLRTVCAALSARDSATLRSELPYFQYNSGLRYGVLGDGEGQTADPGALNAWLASSHVRCTYFTPDVAGHGTLLASGWKRAPGQWSLLELDTFGGSWKVNDFTFGSRAALYAAMQTSHPIGVYRG